MTDIPGQQEPDLEYKGYRSYFKGAREKEGQYHTCKQCGEFWYCYRSYIRVRKYKYDYHKDVYSKGNPRYFQPIGWFCKKCKLFEADTNIPEPIEKPVDVTICKDKKGYPIGVECLQQKDKGEA